MPVTTGPNGIAVTRVITSVWIVSMSPAGFASVTSPMDLQIIVRAPLPGTGALSSPTMRTALTASGISGCLAAS